MFTISLFLMFLVLYIFIVYPSKILLHFLFLKRYLLKHLRVFKSTKRNLVISHIESERPESGLYEQCWSLTCCTRFEASSSEVGSRHQEQNREGGKVQNGQYTTGWAGLLQLVLWNTFSLYHTFIKLISTLHDLLLMFL